MQACKKKEKGGIMLEIKVKYHNSKNGSTIDRIEKIEQGDWIDLRSAENYEIAQFEAGMINLGVSIKVPEGYEAHLVPRGSTYKKWSIIQTNGMGVIDESYSGENDVWKMPVLAMQATHIHKNDRVCQFRIMPKMPEVKITEVEAMDGNSRGGFGSTGTN